MNKKSFSISPSPNVIDVLSSAGYSLNYAIADIIDNSIYAGAKNILVFFDVSTSNPFIYILDDGKGMNIDDLKKAAVPGYTDPNADRDVNDLGRFSVGLKSAAHSFSNDLVIVSKKEKEDKCIIQIDFDYIKNKKEWTAFILNNFDHSYLLKDNGTLVFCDRLNCIESNIDFNTLCTKIDNLETALSHISWKYIENGLNIELGTSYSNQRRKVKGWNPFFLEENKGTKKIYSESIPYKNEKIGIISYILPTYGNLSPNDQRLMRGKGLNDQQGFYVYRNNRLIQEGGWLDLPDMNLDDKCSYARIEMNIPASPVLQHLDSRNR